MKKIIFISIALLILITLSIRLCSSLSSNQEIKNNTEYAENTDKSTSTDTTSIIPEDIYTNGATTDSVSGPSPEETEIVSDTIGTRSETGGGRGPASVDVNIEKKTAVLGYSYIPEMERNEVKNINVFVSVNNSASEIIDTLKQIIQAQAVLTTLDTLISELGTKNIAFYKYLDVTLIDPASAFTITPIHNNARQLLDLNGSNRWRWAIKANTDKNSGILIIKVVAETPEGITDHLDEINIPIKIKIERGILREIYSFLRYNPEYLLSSILIPLAIYFGKKLFDRRNNGDK